MSPALRRALLIAALAFVAGLAGVFVGRALTRPPVGHARVELHDILHHDLTLDPAQHAQLDRLESGFALRKRELELRLRADNARLAAAIADEHGDGAQVRDAVARAHTTMGELQKATLAHVFAMRALLHPAQAAKFDAAVTRALTADEP